MDRSPLLSLAFVTLLAVSLTASAADWPQYRGPHRDDISKETDLLPSWPESGPPLAWKYDNLGLGYSGPAVVGDRLYTLGDRGDDEFLVALDLPPAGADNNRSPREAWAVRVGDKFDWQGNSWSAGPSSTPTVDDGLLFALGGLGDLVCVEAKSGRERWRKHLPTEFAAEVNPIGGGPKKLGWGFTWSPLVDGDRLICLPGGPEGTAAALDKRTGELLWRTKDLTDQAAYTSPIAADIHGVRQYVVLTNQGLAGVATDGKLLWTSRRPQRGYGTEVVNSPIVRDDLVYTTVGAGAGCELIRVIKSGDDWRAEQVYENKNMANHHGNVVLLGDHVYGASQGKGWICQDFKNGEIIWAERAKFRAGAMTYADGRFYLYSEDDASAAIIEASAAGWNLQGKMSPPQESANRKPKGKVWTPPIVSGGRLFLRDQELLFCYDVRKR